MIERMSFFFHHEEDDSWLVESIDDRWREKMIMD